MSLLQQKLVMLSRKLSKNLKINAYESLGFYPCRKGELPEVWKLLLNSLSMKVPVLSLTGQTGFKVQVLSLNTPDS